MTTKTALEIATAAAQSVAVTIEGVTFAATVAERNGLITVTVPENAILTETSSRAMGAATRAAVREALRAAGIRFENIMWTRNGVKSAWRADGAYLHGVFHTSTRFFQVRPN